MGRDSILVLFAPAGIDHRLERIMREYPLDFVQLTYNILDREPEERLLPLARDRGVAVMVNPQSPPDPAGAYGAPGGCRQLDRVPRVIALGVHDRSGSASTAGW
jgi:hypothetical protein